MTAKQSMQPARHSHPRAEALLLEGKKDLAAEEYAGAGDYEKAIALAVESRDGPKAVEYALRAALGTVPPEHAGASALQAGELLAERGHHKEAIALFELSQQFRRAAESARELGQLPRAARFFERARCWAEAADHYQRAGLWNDALRTVEHEESPLLRGEILARLGLSREAGEAYEAAGEWSLAAARWEEAGDSERAGHAWARGERPLDAARCFDAAGSHQLAANAYSQAGDHAAAAASFLKIGQLLDAATELLAAGDKAQATRTLLLIEPGAAEHREATIHLAPLLIEGGMFKDALRRLRGLPDDPAEDAAAGRGKLLACDRLYWQARAHQGLGEAEPARKLYNEVIAAKPGHRDAAERLQELRESHRVYGTLQVERASRAARESRREVSASRELAVGSLLAGRYDLQSELGSGGTGRVYKAYDRELGETVAIKALASSAGPDDEERLLREAQICRRVTHPNVVRVFDLGRFTGGIFITMELLKGMSLEALLASAGPLPVAQTRGAILEICEGLEEAHGLGIVHGDLKPSNILLTAGRLKILDFGTARMVGKETRLLLTGFSAGSPMYMSPEELQGLPVDARSDLYALGIVAFTMLAGREPFQAESPSALALMHLQQMPPNLRKLRPDLPAGWPELVAKLLAKEPGGRYQTAAEVAAEAAKLP